MQFMRNPNIYKNLQVLYKNSNILKRKHQKKYPFFNTKKDEIDLLNVHELLTLNASWQ